MWLIEGEQGWGRFATGQGPPRREQGGVRAHGLVQAQKVGLTEEPRLAFELFEPEVGEIDGNEFEVILAHLFGPALNDVSIEGTIPKDCFNGFISSPDHPASPKKSQRKTTGRKKRKRYEKQDRVIFADPTTNMDQGILAVLT